MLIELPSNLAFGDAHAHTTQVLIVLYIDSMLENLILGHQLHNEKLLCFRKRYFSLSFLFHFPPLRCALVVIIYKRYETLLLAEEVVICDVVMR